MNYTKIIIYAVIIIISFGSGMFMQSKLQAEIKVECPPCPDLIHKCNPAIEVQSLDLDRIRKIKGNFTYSPNFNGDVFMVNKNDTTKIK